MNTDTVGKPEKVDYERELRELSEKREDLTKRLMHLQVQAEQAEREMEELKKEMTELGTSPETLDSDLQKKETEIGQALGTSKTEMEAFEKEIIEAETALGNSNHAGT